jgi:hypothetical protein
MKQKILASFLLIFGFLAFTLAFLRVLLPVCEGCCPGYVSPGVRFQFFVQEAIQIKVESFPNPEGCAPEYRAVYIDFLVISIILMGFGVINLRPRKS